MTTTAMQPAAALEMKCVNAIRFLAIDAVEKANSGHPGLPLGAAPMAFVLWQKHLQHNPLNPHWANRDRFILSAGHGSMLLYSLLHLTGYDLKVEELAQFRQWQSRTPGHPEYHVTPGVEATTGPLGQGVANAVGLAMAERMLAEQYNRPGLSIVDHCTYALVSDGDLMEGIASEACALAGHLKLGKLTFLYDANDISLDGPCSLSFTEDVAKRFEAQGWHVVTVADGNQDLTSIDQALAASRSETERPTLIIVRTIIGFGAPNKQGTSGAHGAPLGSKEVELTRKTLAWDTQAFAVPTDVASHMQEDARTRGAKREADWNQLFAKYKAEHPDLAAQWEAGLKHALPADWDKDLPTYAPGSKAMATRVASGKAINAIAKHVPWFLGGDADLSCSTKTAIDGGGSFDHTARGRNIHFGVREHAMGAIANGMAYHGGLHPYVATFFVFSDYMRPSIRLAALNGLRATFVFTHDSIGVGEDGPTHQPVEHLMSLRVMPRLTVLRPGDANETVEAWRYALRCQDGPVVMVLSRQDLPVVTGGDHAAAEGLHKGAYVLCETAGGAPEAIVIATGSEVSLAVAAKAELEKKGKRIRVVSMPSWEIFAKQSAAYRESVLPASIKARVSVEAGATLGWERWIGDQGASVGIDHFGASAPGEVLMEQFGFSVKNVVATVERVLA